MSGFFKSSSSFPTRSLAHKHAQDQVKASLNHHRSAIGPIFHSHCSAIAPIFHGREYRRYWLYFCSATTFFAPTPTDPQQAPVGESLAEFLELIRTQIRAELQAQQLVGQSTNATAAATPITTSGRASLTNPEPSQQQGIYAMFISIHTY